MLVGSSKGGAFGMRFAGRTAFRPIASGGSDFTPAAEPTLPLAVYGEQCICVGTYMLIRAARTGAPPAASEHWLLDRRVIIHPMAFCPPLPRGTLYCLVKRETGGARTVLGLGATLNSRPLLNLAYIRQRGSSLDANEVLLLEPIAPVLVQGRQSASVELQRGESDCAAGHGT